MDRSGAAAAAEFRDEEWNAIAQPPRALLKHAQNSQQQLDSDVRNPSLKPEDAQGPSTNTPSSRASAGFNLAGPSYSSTNSTRAAYVRLGQTHTTPNGTDTATTRESNSDAFRIFWDGFRSLYHLFLFGIPNFYRNRVHQIFREVSNVEDKVIDKLVARLAGEQIQQEVGCHHGISQMEFYDLTDQNAMLKNLKTLWEGFIEKCTREWKMGVLTSVLLLSVIVGTLQLSDVSSDWLTRALIYLSLIFALMSLLYGCVFWARFSIMRPVYKAFGWAKEGERSGYRIIWNTWILLSLPFTWICWSIIFYIFGIMSFVWRTPNPNEPGAPTHFELFSRISTTFILVIGVLNFACIMLELNGYGSRMDKEWRETVINAAKQRNIEIRLSFQSEDIEHEASSAQFVSESGERRGDIHLFSISRT